MVATQRLGSWSVGVRNILQNTWWRLAVLSGIGVLTLAAFDLWSVAMQEFVCATVVLTITGFLDDAIHHK